VLGGVRDPAKAADLAALPVEVMTLDPGSDASVADLAASLSGTPIDVLFNNAGMMGPRQRQVLGDIAYEAWGEVMAVNVMAPVRMADAFSDHVAASERKQIAVVSSVMGSMADNTAGGFYLYRSSKAAVNMAARSLAADLAPRGITVVMFHPGWVRTDMGGSSAAVSPTDSAAGMLRVMSEVRPKDNGRFFNYDGSEIAW
jgi:NAD(P)-dependent dehydrogenase (short-subunit alcohol dehydrogenase family)